MADEENQQPEDNLEHLEFMNPLEEDAANMHEMFEALMKAGFTERQALMLVAFLISESGDTSNMQIIVDQNMIDQINENLRNQEEQEGNDE